MILFDNNAGQSDLMDSKRLYESGYGAFIHFLP